MCVREGQTSKPPPLELSQVGLRGGKVRPKPARIAAPGLVYLGREGRDESGSSLIDGSQNRGSR